MNIEVKRLKTIIDKRGVLVPIEFKDLNFIPKRLFYVTNVPKNCRRGEHAHYETEQIIVCIKGKVGVKLIYKKDETYFILEENEYIYIKGGTWDAQDFLTGNDVLLVLCSTNYDEKDYYSRKSY